MAEQFSGFPREAITFFKDLARHNNRDWFLAHKHVYESACVQPMRLLTEALAPRFGKSKISRIYRDIRFSADKSPYKTHISASVGRHYVSLSANGLWVGGGMYMPDSPSLERFRNAIADETSGRQLAKLVTALRKKGYDVSTHDTLKSAPKGYTASHPRIDLLRMKDLYAGKAFKPSAWLSTRQALNRVAKTMADVKPLGDWMATHVG